MLVLMQLNSVYEETRQSYKFPFRPCRASEIWVCPSVLHGLMSLPIGKVK
jgi:hypothetical protein